MSGDSCKSDLKILVRENCIVKYYKVFGTGTKLLVTNRPVKQPGVSILASSISDLSKTGSATLLCILQNFFPDVIKVIWNEVGSNKELKSEKGEIIQNNMYSLYSWITVRKSDIGKIYKCKYKHESTENTWKEKAYNTAILGLIVKQPEVTILLSSIKDLNKTTLICNLKNFFPDIIKVVWNLVGSNEELESEEGEIIHNAADNAYSLNSSITLGKSNLGKKIMCKYKHESTGNKWKEHVYFTECPKDDIFDDAHMGFEGLIEFSSISNLTSGEDVNPMVYRAAQLTYTLLLIKSLLYCPILLFVKYKAND